MTVLGFFVQKIFLINEEPLEVSGAFQNTSEEFHPTLMTVKNTLLSPKLREGIIFDVLGFSFLVVGLMIIYSLKKNLEAFYDQFKYYILLATLCLAVP